MAQRVASGCLVFHDGNCLLLRRSALEDTMQGLWEMPAGKIESDLDGSPEENAIRETLEEAGIALGNVVPLGEHLTETKRFYGFLGVSDTADVELSFEHDAFVWMSVPDILTAVAADDMMVGHHTVYFLQQLLDDAEGLIYEAEYFYLPNGTKVPFSSSDDVELVNDDFIPFDLEGVDFIPWSEELFSMPLNCGICNRPNQHYQYNDNVCIPCSTEWIYIEEGTEGEGYYLLRSLEAETFAADSCIECGRKEGPYADTVLIACPGCPELTCQHCYDEEKQGCLFCIRKRAETVSDDVPSDYYNNTPMVIQDLLAHSGGDCDRCGENVPNGKGHYPKSNKELGDDDDTRICLPCFEVDPNFTIYNEVETFSAEKITKEELVEYLDWLENGFGFFFDNSPQAHRFYDLLAGDLQINSADVDFTDEDEFILLGAEEIPMGLVVKSFKTTSKIYYNRKIVRHFYGPRHREQADSIAGHYARKLQKNPNYFSHLRFGAEEYTEDSTKDTDVAIAQSLFALVTIRDLLMQNMTDEALEFINGEYLPEARVDEIIDDDLRAEVQAFIDSKSPERFEAEFVSLNYPFKYSPNYVEKLEQDLNQLVAGLRAAMGVLWEAMDEWEHNGRFDDRDYNSLIEEHPIVLEVMRKTGMSWSPPPSSFEAEFVSLNNPFKYPSNYVENLEQDLNQAKRVIKMVRELCRTNVNVDWEWASITPSQEFENIVEIIDEELPANFESESFNYPQGGIYETNMSRQNMSQLYRRDYLKMIRAGHQPIDIRMVYDRLMCSHDSCDQNDVWTFDEYEDGSTFAVDIQWLCPDCGALGEVSDFDFESYDEFWGTDPDLYPVTWYTKRGRRPEWTPEELEIVDLMTFWPVPSDEMEYGLTSRAESLTGKDMSYCKCGTKDEVGGFTCGQHCSRIEKNGETFEARFIRSLNTPRQPMPWDLEPNMAEEGMPYLTRREYDTLIRMGYTEEEIRKGYQRSYEAESTELGNLIQTDVEIKVYVPTTWSSRRLTELEIRNRVEDVEEKFARWFGGFTTTEAEGGYMDENDNLISEQIFIVSAWVNHLGLKDYGNILSFFLKSWREQWGQEVIGFEFNDKFHMYPLSKGNYEDYRTHPGGLLSKISPTDVYGGDYTDWNRFQVGTGYPDSLLGNLLPLEAESTSKPARVEIKRATIDPYKLTAVFYDKDDKKIKTTHFGDERYEDYTIHKDKERLKNYNTRHGAKSAGEKWQKPMTAGALSKWILWNKPSLKASFDDYKRRFKLKGDLKAKTSGGRKRAETFATEYTPSQTLGEYDARELALSNVATGDFFTDSLKFSTTRKAAESDEDAKKLREYEKTYGKKQAKIRMRLKKKIYKERSMGTKAGQWSARKSQKLKREYEKACERAGLKPYKTGKTEKQEDLEDWTDQDWKTSSGKKSSKTGEPYFPAKAVEALKKKGLYAKAKRQKAKATKAGKQNARYSDDIRKVVAKYRAESFQADTDVVLYFGTSTQFLTDIERFGLSDPMLTLDLAVADDYAMATAEQYGGNAIVVEVSAFADLLDRVDWQGNIFEYYGDIPPAALYVMDWDDRTGSWS